MNQANTTPSGHAIPLNVNGIKSILPHRYPFLLVDRVIDLQPKQSIHAYKNVTCNESFFEGHFPHEPVMPGVLIIEALAQACGLLTQLSAEPKPDGQVPTFYLVKVDNARFARPVVPGDQLQLEVVQKRMIRNMGIYSAVARVGDDEAAVADIVCAER